MSQLSRRVTVPRIDAQRNIDALLAAAKEEFAVTGVDASVRAIAARAGVGTATLYRHYPLRSDLISAVFRREIDDCAAAASQLAGAHDPDMALDGDPVETHLDILAVNGPLPAAVSGAPW
jgi:AcrR family transcriptional regulator